jgi:transcriptional regulator with XRE-family HTH domain
MVVMEMDTPLSKFVSQRRADLRYSREDVSSAARRQGLEISQAYIAKIENGADPETISLEKYKALAAGLNISPDALAAILRGTPPSAPAEIESRPPRSPGVLSLIQGGQHEYPLTDREEATLREALVLDIQPHAPFTDPGFMDRDLEDEIREEAFMLLRQLIRNTKQSRGMR